MNEARNNIYPRLPESLVGKIIIHEHEGIELPLYNLQVEAASIRLSPVYVNLRRAGELRLALNDSLATLQQPTEPGTHEMNFKVAGGVFLAVDREIPFTSYLQDSHAPFPEISGYGVKRPEEQVVFGEFKLRSVEDGPRIEVEMEIIEFHDKSYADLVLDFKPNGRASRYTAYNLLKFNPEHHQVGFFDYLGPDIEVS